MDPVTAFQVAASVVAFIDFSRTLVSDTRRVYKSSDGRSARAVKLSKVAEELGSVKAQIEKHMTDISPTGSDDEMLKVCRECGSIGAELQSTVARLTAQGSTKLEYAKSSFAVAVKGLWKEGQFGVLIEQLEKLRSRLMMSLMVSVW